MTNYRIGVSREFNAMKLAVGNKGFIVKGGGSKSVYPPEIDAKLKRLFGKGEKKKYPKIDFMAMPVPVGVDPLQKPLAVIVTDAKHYTRDYLENLLRWMKAYCLGKKWEIQIWSFKKPKPGLSYEIEIYS